MLDLTQIKNQKRNKTENDIKERLVGKIREIVQEKENRIKFNKKIRRSGVRKSVLANLGEIYKNDYMNMVIEEDNKVQKYTN